MPDEAKHNEYTQLLLTTEKSLRGYILAHVRDFDTAEDILQQTAMTLWRKFDEYDRRRPFVGWALGMARFEILNARRRLRRHEVVFDSELAEKLASRYAAMEQELSERRVALRRCLKKLRGPAQRALALRYEAGLELRGICRELGKSLAAVKVLLFRARAALKACIARELSGREAPS
ncbi:MAG: sigma-70 family RNA polymerase sigma factor [Kiritimatiellae bacterium]|nr:sigma-70 family RNA polymerase sigma factor [Kiritimatiellia bacterium]